jgi:hypothetical protein
MYTQQKYYQIKKLAQLYNGESVCTERGVCLKEKLTFNDISDLLDEIDHLGELLGTTPEEDVDALVVVEEEKPNV